MKAGGQFVGILGTPIELSDFSGSFVSKDRIRETGYLYMFDASGTVLAHPDAAKIMSLNIGSTDFGREMLNQSRGSLSYEYEGILSTAHFQRSQRKPWRPPKNNFTSWVRSCSSILAERASAGSRVARDRVWKL